MSDSLEQLIRQTLRDEASSLTLDVSAPRVARLYEQRRRARIVHRAGLLAAAAAVALVALATLVLYRGSNHIAASPTPPPTTPAVVPSGSARPTSTASISLGPDQSLGTLSLDFQTPAAAHAEAPIVCTWTDQAAISSFAITRTQATMFGEPVVVASAQTGAGNVLVLERSGHARYAEGSPQVLAFAGAHYTGNVILTLDTTSGGDPAPFASAGPELDGSFNVDCGWAPAGIPLASLDPSGTESRGTATLTLTTPGAAAVQTPVQCSWSSRQKVSFYDFPVSLELLGEPVLLALSDPGDPSHPVLAIERGGTVAAYTGRGATYEAHGYLAAAGSIDFTNLTPDPESYQPNVPLPSPIDPFVRPLGGDAAARSLAGTLTWDCGQPPAAAPATEPPSAPPSSAEPSPVPYPQAVVTVAGATTPTSGEASCGAWRRGPDGQFVGGVASCGGPSWWVPAKTVEVPAGAAVTFAVPGWNLTAKPLTYASVSEVIRWRGGIPDTAVSLQPASWTATSASFSLPAGDWVIAFQVAGSKADGSTIGATFLFHLHVAG